MFVAVFGFLGFGFFGFLDLLMRFCVFGFLGPVGPCWVLLGPFGSFIEPKGFKKL